MTNAKDELIRTLDTIKNLENHAEMKCAIIAHNRCFDFDESAMNNAIILKVNHTDDDLEEFRTKLDFKYDSGYGGQELYGTVWLDDGTWLSIGEYDGSEWWEHHACPEIPKECI